jgi:NDP-sugar pyrophosphorylase family protein
MSLPVAILAGGEARRLRPITQRIPKALVEVAGRPFIHYQLDYLKAQGFSDVVLCVGFLGEQIQDVIGDGSAFGLSVRYSSDGPSLLGTGGALRRALPLLGERFLVFYGDTYLPIDFRKVEEEFLSSGKPALITVLKNAGSWDTSNAVFREGVVSVYSKRDLVPEMDYIDYGLGALSASVFERTPEGQPVDLGDIYHDLSVRGLLAGYEVFERFHEIGSPAALKETEQYLRVHGTQ